MSLKQTRNYRSLRQQRGFLIPVAIFIVVIMSFFALALWRTTVQTSLASAQELVSMQAFYAAESGAQFGMQKLFYPDGEHRALVNDHCNALNETPQTLNFSAPGLGACSAIVSCICEYCDAAQSTSFYTIQSVGACGAGNIRSERTIRVGSSMEQE